VPLSLRQDNLAKSRCPRLTTKKWVSKDTHREGRNILVFVRWNSAIRDQFALYLNSAGVLFPYPYVLQRGHYLLPFRTHGKVDKGLCIAVCIFFRDYVVILIKRVFGWE